VGIFGYPVSYTTWQAVDLWMRPPTDADFGDGAARAVEGLAGQRFSRHPRGRSVLDRTGVRR